ncbi:hypothetical protein, conserved [Eimeria maxima]|uniref:Uncharacterized protein n=1 Tax=Eimeria maxima TaxID=5804 RepID=U6LWM5_EIMMA|nr:hypothetical protein, conserved [Eimeria maxima]CDJ56362.1 hypothetical protein, conserved [Eimeria maxima]
MGGQRSEKGLGAGSGSHGASEAPRCSASLAAHCLLFRIVPKYKATWKVFVREPQTGKLQAVDAFSLLGLMGSSLSFAYILSIFGLLLSSSLDATLAASGGWGPPPPSSNVYPNLGGFYPTSTPASPSLTCTTPSIQLPYTHLDYERCRTEYSVSCLTEGEWQDLKWGSIEVMCRPSSNLLVFFLENSPRFSWNPWRIATATARRVAGSVDIRTASLPLSSFCECSTTPPRPFFVERFQKEQYIVGATVQSMPRKVFEFFGDKTNCEVPRHWSDSFAPVSAAAAAAAYHPSNAAYPTAALPAAAAGPAAAAPHVPLFEFKEVYRCTWKFYTTYQPRVFVTRGEVLIGGPSQTSASSGAALSGPAAAAAASAANTTDAAAAVESAVARLSLPPACHMYDVPAAFRVWVRPAPTPAAATASAGAPTAAAAGMGLMTEQQRDPSLYEVVMQIDTTKQKAQTHDAVYYRRLVTTSDFDLAVSRGQP